MTTLGNFLNSWPTLRCMTTLGNFFTLNFAQMSASSSVIKPNLAVRLKTVSLERAFKMVGGDFLLEKIITFGLEASDVSHASIVSLVSFTELSGIIFESLPATAFA